VYITGSWGLGENIVQGAVTPDEYYVFKPTLKEGKRPIVSKRLGSKEIKMIYDNRPDARQPVINIATTESERNSYILNDDELLQLARWAMIIEEHYGCNMDVEWAKLYRAGPARDRPFPDVEKHHRDVPAQEPW